MHFGYGELWEQRGGEDPRVQDRVRWIEPQLGMCVECGMGTGERSIGSSKMSKIRD